MWNSNRLVNLLGLRVPIIQAPMAGATTPALAAAVSNAGAMGSHGCAMHSASALADDLEAIRAATNGSYNVNFFVHPEPAFNPEDAQPLRKMLEPFYREFGADVPEVAPPIPTFDEARLEVLLAAPPPVVSFHFGLPAPDMVARLKAAGARILSSATTPAEARWLERGGADAIIAQGYEAGGHRGTFVPPYEVGNIGTMALVPLVVDAVNVPVIAAGGIADGRGVAAAMMLGASGVQIGTAFLSCPEAATASVHRDALLNSSEAPTALTSGFSGRPARGIENRFMREMAGREDELPPFPIPNGLTGPLRRDSAAQNNPDYLPLWAGQAYALNRAMPAAELVEVLANEAAALLNAG